MAKLPALQFFSFDAASYTVYSMKKIADGGNFINPDLQYIL
jgi:hypothetical protein